MIPIQRTNTNIHRTKMPTVHCIRRKWLEQRKFQACLHQAEKIRKTTEDSDNKSNDENKLLSLTCTAPSLSAYSHVDGNDSPDQLLLTETPHEHHCVAAPSKKRRLSPSLYHSNIISPQTTASGDYNDDESVISETPVLHSRKRKMKRSCQKQQAAATDGRLLEISAAIRDNITPKTNDL